MTKWAGHDHPLDPNSSCSLTRGNLMLLQKLQAQILCMQMFDPRGAGHQRFVWIIQRQMHAHRCSRHFSPGAFPPPPPPPGPTWDKSVTALKEHSAALKMCAWCACWRSRHTNKLCAAMMLMNSAKVTCVHACVCACASVCICVCCGIMKV